MAYDEEQFEFTPRRSRNHVDHLKRSRDHRSYDYDAYEDDTVYEDDRSGASRIEEKYSNSYSSSRNTKSERYRDYDGYDDYEDTVYSRPEKSSSRPASNRPTRRKRRGGGRVFLIFLLVIVLVAGAFVGWKLLGNNGAEPTPTPTITPDPTPTPIPTPKPIVFVPAASEDTLPSKFNVSTSVTVDGSAVSDYQASESLNFPRGEDYTELEGIITFRGNNFRNMTSYGTAEITEETITKTWEKGVGGIDGWGGVGWNGQAVVVKWPAELRQQMNLYDDAKSNDDLIEVIYASLDGNIYFLDLDTGEATRDPIKVGYPIKGSVNIDPRGYPLLYVGQGIGTNGGVSGPFGYRIFSLIDSEMLLFINGKDSFARRNWAAFDSNAIVDASTDTMMVGGENGVTYFVKLNSNYDAAAGTISIDPVITRYRYSSSLSKTLGVECSLAAYGKYVFIPDNSGSMQCLDTDTMEPVWIRSITDDTDSSPVLDVEDDKLYIYTGCEADKQTTCYVRKIDAETGETVWEYSVKCSTTADINGGLLATPNVGKHDLEGYVYFYIGKASDSNYGGKLMCFDKKTGETVWTYVTKAYGWSSPVELYTEEGKGYLVVGDAYGNIYLLDGKTGELKDQINVESTIEGSAVAYGNKLVLGLRGYKIIGLEVH